MAMMNVSLAYADNNGQHYQEMSVPQGTNVYQAIMLSGWLDLPILSEFKTWCANNMTSDPNHKAWYVGIYSQKKRLDEVLSEGDRIEIYRPLSYDPMTRRKTKSKTRLKKLGYQSKLRTHASKIR